MADPLRKVRPGETLRIPAAAYNAFVDAARFVEGQETGNGASASRAHRSAGIVLAKNRSGGDRQRFDVLGVEKPIIGPDANFDEFKNRVAPLLSWHLQAKLLSGAASRLQAGH